MAATACGACPDDWWDDDNPHHCCCGYQHRSLSVDGNCKLCPANWDAPANHADDAACGAPNFHLTNPSSQTACARCPNGWVTDKVGPVDYVAANCPPSPCPPAPAPTTPQPTHAHAVCAHAVPNTSANKARLTCTQCVPGTYEAGHRCVACGPGMSSGAGATLCTAYPTPYPSSMPSPAPTSQPTDAGSADQIVDVAVGSYHTCFRRADQRAACTAMNGKGGVYYLTSPGYEAGSKRAHFGALAFKSPMAVAGDGSFCLVLDCNPSTDPDNGGDCNSPGKTTVSTDTLLSNPPVSYVQLDEISPRHGSSACAARVTLPGSTNWKSPAGCGAPGPAGARPGSTNASWPRFTRAGKLIRKAHVPSAL